MKAVRTILRLSLVSALVVSLALPLAVFAGQGGGGGGGLSKHDRALLAQAIVNGDTTVTLLIASTPGSNKTVANGIKGLGGTVRYQEDSISYISAIVPVDKVEAAAALSGVEALDLNEIIPLEDPRPDSALPVIPQPAPGAGTPNNNPYMPIGDTGASQFMAANPTWDGRGVTIGFLDTGMSLDNPSLLTTSTGERKIIDWVTATDPFNDNDPTWVNMQSQVTAPNGTFTFTYVNSTVVVNPGPPPTKSFVSAQVTETFTAPAAGTYRVGIIDEHDARLGGEVGRDLNRDGNPGGSRGVFAVLWNTKSNTVYVDTNQNNNFADDMAMTDYKVNFDVNYFGVDNPATPVAERMPFVVQTDGKNKVVNIGIVSGAHGSHTAGIAAGNSLFGGAMSGAAPGAKLVSVRTCLFIVGCTSTALVEGMIYAAKQSNVDVINMSIGGLPALNDGNNARARLYNRLIEQYNVQMFISAGNDGPGMNTIGDPSVATLVMSVGAYITDDTYLADYGAQVYEQDNLHLFSSRGPREDGGFKPDIVAPGAAISTTPLWQAGGPVAGTYALPPGYSLFNGTSMAAPQAAGAAALLVSAAKQAGVQHQPAQIRQALRSSARYLAGRYQAYEQGNGLIDVGAAWDLLTTNIKTNTIQSSVEVHTVLSGFLATPGVGVGINDREGVVAGDSYMRTYTFVRTSGPGGTITYDLNWVDNDGTFSSDSSIALPKNVPVTLDVTVNPAASGAHSAILNLDDPSNAGIEYQTMNVVIVADQFTGPSYSVTKSGNLGPQQVMSFFFYVPAGTPAFKVDMTGGGGAGLGAIRFLRWHPYGVGIDSNAVSNCYNGTSTPPFACLTGSPTSRTTSNPQAGVWEVTVDARRNSDAVSAPFTLTASILGATVSPNPDLIASATIGVPVARSYTLTNLFGAFTGRAVGTTLGSAFRATPTIANLEQQVYLVNVTAGSTSLRATIGSPSDPAADLDLFVFRPNGTLGGQSADGDSEESVTINNPVAGTWTVLVDGFSVPAGTTTYNYVDVFANAAFGSVSVTDANALRTVGASWTVPGSVTANAAPAAGRVLLGNVQVRTDTDALVGSGDVIVNSVTP